MDRQPHLAAGIPVPQALELVGARVLEAADDAQVLVPAYLLRGSHPSQARRALRRPGPDFFGPQAVLAELSRSLRNLRQSLPHTTTSWGRRGGSYRGKPIAIGAYRPICLAAPFRPGGVRAILPPGTRPAGILEAEGRSASRPQLRVGDGNVIAVAETDHRDAETLGLVLGRRLDGPAKELYACRS